MSALDTLRAATPARKTVWLCMDAALEAEWDRTLAEYENAEDIDHSSLEKPRTLEMAERLDAVRDRMRASEVGFTFERVGPWQGLALQSQHPPRDGNPIDRIRGFNIETYYPALIRAACVSVSKRGEDPEPIPDEVWDSLLGKPAVGEIPAVVGTLNTSQTNKLIGAAQHVNDGETKVPPSARSLLESQDFGASLAQPSPGPDQAPSDSMAGNPPGSPSTSMSQMSSTLGDESDIPEGSSAA